MHFYISPESRQTTADVAEGKEPAVSPQRPTPASLPRAHPWDEYLLMAQTALFLSRF